MNIQNLQSVQEAAYFGGMSQSRINNPVLSLAPSQVGILLCENSRGGATVKPSHHVGPGWASRASVLRAERSRSALIQVLGRVQALGEERHSFVLCG